MSLSVAATGSSRAAGPSVYEAKVLNKAILLGPQSSPTELAVTPPLPAGTYLVHATVGVVVGPNDNVVCATSPVSTPAGTNDSVFGSAGNGATESGTGPNGVYGIATILDTWQITTSGDQIRVVCTVGHYGAGTYAGGAVIVAEPLSSLMETIG